MDPQNAVQDLPVILVRPPRPGRLRRQQRFQPLPVLVGQVSASHGTEMGIQTRNVSRLQTRPSTTVAYRPCTALTHHILWLSSALSAKYAVLIHYATVVLALQLHIAHVRLSRTTFCGYLRHFPLNMPS